MVAGMLRHMSSLVSAHVFDAAALSSRRHDREWLTVAVAVAAADQARMKRDYGWVHTLLEEAENERMHLLTFIKARRLQRGAHATAARVTCRQRGVFEHSVLSAHERFPSD